MSDKIGLFAASLTPIKGHIDTINELVSSLIYLLYLVFSIILKKKSFLVLKQEK